MAKSGNFREGADSERKASRETFGRATDESGDMAPDEDREAAGIARFQVAKSGNFQEYADSERKDFRDTFERMLTRREKPLGKLSGWRLMKMEKWRLTKTARQQRYRETAEIARQ